MTWSQTIDLAVQACGSRAELAEALGVTRQALEYMRKKGVPDRCRAKLLELAGLDPLPVQTAADGARAFARPRCFDLDDWKRWRAGGGLALPCHDCTADWRRRMQAEGRCDRQGEFRPAPDQSPPVQRWVQARFTR